ncbi:MAG: hypothetical protein HN582_08835 [Marinovum sp.]|nr:hypothetical protein [Marinovum sp.]MBT7907582.1 hypothetical protein [Marinovum sp.]
MSGSYKEIFDDILLDLAKLRNIRKDSSDYLESCNQIASKVGAALADISDEVGSFEGNEKVLLEEIYSQLTAEETYANAAADLRDISDLNRLLDNE